MFLPDAGQERKQSGGGVMGRMELIITGINFR